MSDLTHALEETAAEWWLRLDASDCTDAERARFEEWRAADPAHDEVWRAVAEMMDVADDARADPGARSFHAASRARVEARRGQRNRGRWAAGAAALAASLAVVTAAVGLYMRGPAPRSLGEAGVYATALGERSTFTLADGSVVTLNTATRLKVDYVDDARRVELLQGQALFEVAHDASRPFTVTAGERRITALGTVFDVRFETQALAVTLVEGRVAVDEVAPEPGHAAPERLAELAPNEQFRASSEGASEVRATDVARVTSWRSGKLIFDGERLADAVAEVNRYSAEHVVLGDATLEDFKVSGVFRAGNVDTFVATLEAAFPIRAHGGGADPITLTWRGDARPSE